ncbi:MAG: hypothetical protein Q4D38_02220, partial [Planctomycetia bacterium]|nr:hypothetical protein [Planctomycetia bacterium]
MVDGHERDENIIAPGRARRCPPGSTGSDDGFRQLQHRREAAANASGLPCYQDVAHSSRRWENRLTFNPKGVSPNSAFKMLRRMTKSLGTSSRTPLRFVLGSAGLCYSKSFLKESLRGNKFSKMFPLKRLADRDT